MGRRVMVGFILGAWLLVACAGLLVFLAALRQAHLADERIGSHDVPDPEGVALR